MSKVIAIMEKPKDCNNCPFVICKYSLPLSTTRKGYYCQLNGDGVVEDFGYEEEVHLSNCPLREVPKKQRHRTIDNEFQRGAKTGWNFCINEILKGSEEE